GVAGQSFRTCLRLEPPETEKQTKADDRSRVLRFLLQVADDPSQLVPADRVWSETGPSLYAFGRQLDRPQERLLADLGRAARLFPPLEVGLAGAHPTACYLTATEAYEFLRETAPLLEEGGFAVLVPAWWTRGARRLGVKVRLGAAD